MREVVSKVILYPCTVFKRKLIEISPKVYHGHGYVCCRVASQHVSTCLRIALLGSLYLTKL